MQLVRVLRQLSSALVANDVRPAARGIRDARIERALVALASRISERWTVAKLARVAGLSRAAFARRFQAEVGAPPGKHLAALRARRAIEILAASDAPLAVIAAEIGYANEFVLSRAFRRAVGAPPAVVRRQLRSLPTCPTSVLRARMRLAA